MIKRTASRIFIFLFLLFSLAGFGGAWGLVREGNKLFAAGQYDQALTRYTDAQLGDPDNPRLQYNIGTVLYKQKKFKEALESFQKVIATSDENEIKEKAFYNMGNAYFRQAESAGDIELLSKAVDAYTEALKLDPNDADAKYNLEVARRMLELKKKENPQQQCQNPQNNQNQNQNQNQQNAQNKQNKPEENKPSTAEASVNPQENKQATSETQNAAPGKMTREEAEQLLKALEEKERENAREQQQTRISGRRPFAGKDW